jgi:hypothetical protein
MHNRYLAGRTYAACTPFESYHWAKASALFRTEISHENDTCNWDAFWIAAVMMSFLVCFAVETEDPQALWPLSLRPSLGVSWYRAQRGVRTFWTMLRPSSPFAKGACGSKDRCLDLPIPPSGVEGVSTALVTMCELNDSSNANNSPYHTAVRTLSILLADPTPGPLRFLAFMNTTEPEFERLLEQRDPRSLVLMTIWFSLIPRTAWWIWSRAQLERRAICIFLERDHQDHIRIWPVMRAWSQTEA